MDPFNRGSDAQLTENLLEDYPQSLSHGNHSIEALVHSFGGLGVSSPRIETPRFSIRNGPLYPYDLVYGQTDVGYKRASDLMSNLWTWNDRVDGCTWHPRFHEYGSYPRLSGTRIAAEGISESNIYPALSRPGLNSPNRMNLLGHLDAYPREVSRWNLNARTPTEINTCPSGASVVALSDASIEDLRGKMRNLAKSPLGHKILLEKMKAMQAEEVEIILGDLVKYIGGMMVDPFGNRVIEKLVEACSDRQRAVILSSVTWDPQLIRICIDQYGSRIIQKLLESLTPNWQKEEFVLAIYPGVIQLSKNSNGRHVIKHCLDVFPARYNKLLSDRLADNFYEIATDQHGCQVVSQHIKNVQGKWNDRVVAASTAHALPLAQHQYGNYVVQDLLTQQFSLRLRNEVHQQFTGCYSSLSRNKFASHVVEKCLLSVEDRDFMQIVCELMDDDFPLLLSDEYANYVVQAMIVRSNALSMPTYDILVDRMRASRHLIESSLYGRKALDNLKNKHKISIFNTGD